MRRFVAKILILCVLIIAINVAVDYFLFDDIHSYTRMMMEEMYQYQGNIDTLFIGSSHAYRSFNVAMADQLLGVNTFNAGSSSQSLNTCYYLLREINQYHKVKTVYLELYYSILDHSPRGITTQQWIISDYMRNGINKLEFLWDTAGLGAILDNVFRFRHGEKDILRQLDTLKLKLTDGFKVGDYRHIRYAEDEYRGKGFVYTHETVDPKELENWNDAIDPNQPISDFSELYLRRIVDFCKERGIRLVFVTAPMPEQTIRRTTGYQAFHDHMAAYAEREGLDYYDFNLVKPSVLSLAPSDFQDNSHLNGAGAEKFTQTFCDIMNRLKEDTMNVEDVFYAKLEEKPVPPEATDLAPNGK